MSENDLCARNNETITTQSERVAVGICQFGNGKGHMVMTSLASPIALPVGVSTQALLHTPQRRWCVADKLNCLLLGPFSQHWRFSEVHW